MRAALRIPIHGSIEAPALLLVGALTYPPAPVTAGQQNQGTPQANVHVNAHRGQRGFSCLIHRRSHAWTWCVAGPTPQTTVIFPFILHQAHCYQAKNKDKREWRIKHEALQSARSLATSLTQISSPEARQTPDCYGHWCLPHPCH